MAATSPPLRVGLALQGGGAHGAYGWGVIDRLLEAGVLIAAVSGASAGALNGAALVTGLAEDGPDGARATLKRLWTRVAERSPLKLLDWAGLAGPLLEPFVRQSLDMTKLASRYVTPFTPGLANMATLRRVVSESIDLDRLSDPATIPLHVSATRVTSGGARLFSGEEVTLDALMASACLPDLFAAVTIDGEQYWDGGFSANPALGPLVLNDCVTDVLVAQITPFAAAVPGRSTSAIARRVSDIGFNAALLRDLAALTTMQDIARAAPDAEPRLTALAEMNLHLIEPPEDLSGYGKLDTRWSQLTGMRDLGRAHAGAWLGEHSDSMGRRSTLLHLPEAVAA